MVEDFTGNGLHDLKNRIARTPLTPSRTFENDPLRVLRVIRFKHKFDLTFAEDLAPHVNSQVLSDIQHKIAAERKKTELDKILAGKNPHEAI